MAKFNLVDAPTGYGKTTTLLKKLKEEYPLDGNKRYICIVLLNTEEQRYKKELGCFIPKDNIKLVSLKELVKDGRNIVTTHAMFNKFDSELIELIRNSKYEYDLFIDEQPTLVRGTMGGDNFENKDCEFECLQNVNKYDIESMISTGLLIKDDLGFNKYKWNDLHPYNQCRKGTYFELRKFLAVTNIYVCEFDKKAIREAEMEVPKCFIAFTSPRIFNVFKEVWIISYLLKDSIVEDYMRLNQITDYNFYHIENLEFKEGYKFYYPRNIIERIEINDFDKCVKFSLSKTGYSSITEEEKKKLVSGFHNFRRRCENKLKRKRKIVNKDYIWTTFKAFKKGLYEANPKYISTKSFLACNVKATNDYVDTIIVGYLIDKHTNPMLKKFLSTLNIEYNNKLYALSELIQFIWRSNIRKEDSEEYRYNN